MALRTNSFFVSLGAVIRLLISLISIPLLARYLGIERYGIWVVINSVIAIAGLMELGLSTALTNYLSAELARQDWLNASRSITISFVLITILAVASSFFLWLGHPQIAHFFFFEDSHLLETLSALGLISWLLILKLWQQWAMAVEAAYQRYDIQAAIETAGAIILQLGFVLFAMVNSRLWMLVAWSLGITGISVMIHSLVLKNLFAGHIVRVGYCANTAKILVRFGATQWLSNLGASLFGYADRILVNLFLGTEAAGLYSVGTSIAIQINTLSAIPLRVLPPAISAAKALANDSRVRQIFVRATKLNGLVVLFTAAPVLFWAPQLSVLLVGPEHTAATTQILRILALTYGIYSLGVASHFTALGVGSPGLNALWGVLGAVTSLGFMAIFMSVIGLAGAAWGNIGYALTLVVNFLLVRKLNLKHSIYLRLFIPSLSILLFWWLLSGYENMNSLSIWTKIFSFPFLVILSVLILYGPAFIRNLFDDLIEIFKNYLPQSHQKL